MLSGKSNHDSNLPSDVSPPVEGIVLHPGSSDEAGENQAAPNEAAHTVEKADIEIYQVDTKSTLKSISLGRFALQKQLGEGAFGVVYQAHDPQLDREVALKVAKTGTLASSRQTERFFREARAAAQLRHPNIVPVFDAGQDGGQHYIASALIRGQTLDAVLQHRRLPLRQSAQIVSSLADALAYAHEQGIVHRDVKPANVMLDVRGQPLLMDFGLAARQDEDAKLTQDGAVLGTPLYMAPENASGHCGDAQPRSDQYSLGVVLYQMLCGQTPFVGPTRVVLVNHQETDPPQPRHCNPAIPRDLETICLKALAKKPEDRYDSCRDLADDLRRWLADEPIRARPPGLVERLRKWGRRRPAAAALLVVSILAFGASFAAVASYADSKRQEADLANEKLARAERFVLAQEQVNQELRRAALAESSGNWQSAHAHLKIAQGACTNQEGLSQGEVRDEVERRLAHVEERLAEQGQQQEAALRRQRFEMHRFDALFHETPFTGLGGSENREFVSRAARTALALYGLGAEPGKAFVKTPDEERPARIPRHDAELASACYELLLMWAEAEAAGTAGAPDLKPAERAKRALALLDRAAELGRTHGLTTRAWQTRRVRYLAQAGAPKHEKGSPAADVNEKGPLVLDLYLAAWEDYRTGHFHQAAVACAGVLEHEPRHFWARYVRGVCQMQAARWADAGGDFTICLHQRPNFDWARLLRGVALTESAFANQDPTLFAAARADFDHILHKQPDVVARYTALINRGVLFIRQQQWEDARRPVLGLAVGTLVREIPQPKLKDALRDLKQASELKPERFHAYLNLAKVHRELRQGKEAVGALDRAIERAPNLALLYGERGRLRLQEGNRAGARADYEKAIALELGRQSPRVVADYLDLARLLTGDSQYEAALTACEAALKIQPDNGRVLQEKASALLGLRRYTQASEVLDKYLARATSAPPEVYHTRGLIHARAGQYPAAINMFTLALHGRPDDLSLRAMRGWSLLHVDGARQALDDFQLVLARDPNNTEALCGRGYARVRLKQVAEAVADADAAERGGPLGDRLTYSLACLYALAVEQLAQEPLPRSNATAARLTQYEELALVRLRQALEQLPAKDRVSFWRERVETDPAWKGLRRGNRYLQLAAECGRQ
jgi:tetratricopeptide (TPR) repeat protein/tRNA A-37 threonylcarbamoyl transferase component Bud32